MCLPGRFKHLATGINEFDTIVLSGTKVVSAKADLDMFPNNYELLQDYEMQ
jgi:hypothetical protein